MTQPAHSARTYGQFCPVAAGLDIVGDRWVLLILREMSIGRRRFSEIKRACPGIAPNLLAERLRTLSDRGLVDSNDSGYALTEAGERVRPVLRALAVFGVDHLDPDDPESPDSDVDAVVLARGIVSPYQDPQLAPIHVRVKALNGTACDLIKRPGDTAAVVAHPHGAPDVEFTAAPADVLRARRDSTPFDAEISGDAASVDAFLTGFALSGVVQRRTTSAAGPSGDR